MNNLTKFLLTIPSIVAILYLLTFFSVDFFQWVTQHLISYKYLDRFVNVIMMIQLVYLIYRIWQYKNINKDNKALWTVLILMFNFIACLLYIWKKDDELRRKDNNLL